MLPTEPFRASSALDDWPDSPLDCISPAQGDVEVAHGGDEHGEDREAIHAGANQEGGQVQQLSGSGFAAMPSALAQGRLPVSTLRAEAAQWGSELKAAGVNLDLAPVMDVVPQATASTNGPIGVFDREFGYDPVTNGTHGAAFIEGLAQAGVAATFLSRSDRPAKNGT